MPVVEATFYPEEEPFRVLAQAIRTSCRTFELFEIARLILEKPDRFVCVVKDPEQKEGDPARLHASVPDGLPFRSEEEALAHALKHYMEDFFEKETVEVAPPSGSFQMVHKCGLTGELLGAPNYHRYQALCRAHHAAKLAHMPYSRFEQRIESSREEADIQGWLDKMRVQTHYKSKENPEQVFHSFEDARLSLITQGKDKLVRPAYSARFAGKALALLNPSDPIRRSVEMLLENQRKFPLDTANHLRGRLRRMNFAVYKRGSKGVSYVCAVKRRFRQPNEVLADNLQELIDFLEAHPNYPAKELPRGFLGIDPAKRVKPPAAAQAAAKEMVKEVAEGIGEPEVAAVAEKAEPVRVELTAAEQASIRQLMTDLRYLVGEGYVTEFSDGRLFVPAIREEEIRRVEKAKEEAEAAPASEENPAGSSGEGVPTPEPLQETATPIPEAPATPEETSEETPVETPAEPPVAEQPEAMVSDDAVEAVPEPLDADVAAAPETAEEPVEEPEALKCDPEAPATAEETEEPVEEPEALKPDPEAPATAEATEEPVAEAAEEPAVTTPAEEPERSKAES